MNLPGVAYLTTVPAMLMVKEVQERRWSVLLIKCSTLSLVTAPVLSTTSAVTSPTYTRETMDPFMSCRRLERIYRNNKE